MKIKKTIGLVLVLGILVSLCSCTSLNELKDKYAFFFENENGVECISYNESTYIPYDIENTIAFGYSNEINVTHSFIDMKVPVLLSDDNNFKTEFYATDGYEILRKSNLSYPIYYVREDYYDEFDDIVKLKKDLYYCDISHPTFIDEKITRLSDELTSVIDDILTKTEPVDISENHYFSHITTIEMCDKNARFYLPYAAYLQIWECEGKYVIGTVTVEDDGFNRFLYYEIPQDKLWLFKSEIDRID